MNPIFFRILAPAATLALISAVATALPASRAAAGQSEIAPTNSFKLDALVAEVLERNPELNFYLAEIAAAKGERRATTARANPELELSGGEKRITGGGLSDEGMAWSVSLQQSFEWPGRIPLRKAIANHQIRLAELGLAQFKAALASRARTLAFNLSAAREKSVAAQEVADRFQQLRQVLVQRDPAGLTPQLEMRIIEATELTFQRQATEAALAVREAQLELNYLRGDRWAASINIEPIELTFSPAPELATLIAASRTNNFELQMRRVELEQQGFKVSLTRKEGYPSFAVGPYFSSERAGDREQQVGIGISIPLPLWNRNKGNVEIAEARLKQAETLLFTSERELDRQIVENGMIYETKLSEIAKWRSESIREFRQAAALADRHYRLGAVPLATYIELQKQYLEAVEALLDTRREALLAAEKIQLLTGIDFNAVQIASAGESSTP